VGIERLQEGQGAFSGGVPRESLVGIEAESGLGGVGSGPRGLLVGPEVENVAVLVGLLGGEPVGGVHGGVDSEMAPLAAGDNVLVDEARWVAFAEVGDGEGHSAVKPLGGLAVDLDAAAGVGPGLVQSALSGALAASVGAVEADGGAERGPVLGVAVPVNGHC
jgi:hypothetical protein